MNRRAAYFTILITLLSSLFIVTCSKEYSYEGGTLTPAQSAAYTFIISGNNCAGAIVNGIYQAGKALDASNEVQLNVYVTKTGSYAQTFNNVNGISFSSSGIFTDTGRQAITLIGTGKPLSEGAFNFTTNGSVCGFLVKVAKAVSNVAGFSLVGAPGVCQSPVINGSYIYRTALTASNFVTLKVNVQSPGSYSVKSDTLNGISFEASGNFTSTGNQTLKLMGKGIPQQAGIFNFIFQGDSTGCSFNIEMINSQPFATYVIESGSGNPNPCISTVNGIYTANTVLNINCIIKINVFVTVVGNYTIQSNKVNGMQFSFTGTFASTGNQTVELQGNGTPVAIGTFLFTPQIVGPHPLGGQSCAVKVEVK